MAVQPASAPPSADTKSTGVSGPAARISRKLSAVLRLFQALRNSRNGLLACARSEQAFRQELAVLLLALPVAYWLATNLWRWLALIGVLLLILVVELLNTAIEKLADQVTRDSHPAIGHVKDMGSAAVGLSLLIAAVVWLAALAERFGLL
jgi:diacylglycerol kinase (ATP)